tara:strand:- start:259 stop:609 length:351 start_codon:yes stop_codon:yes gene_type:complete
MGSEEDSGLDDFVDAVMEFVGDEDVQRGAGYLILGGVAIGALIGVYIIIKMYYQQICFAIFVIGALMLWLRKEPVAYCQDCGNTLGRGEPSRPCSRCKCNRWSYTDPGVGMTIKNR